MYSLKKLFKNGILILILIIAFIPNASSQDCFAPSPTRQPGEKIPSIKTRELTQTEYENLNTFIHSMVGDWKGTGKELKCSGTVSDPSQEIIRYTIKGESILDSSGKFSLILELYSPEQKATHSEKQDLYLTEKSFRAGSFDVEFIEISANRIKFRQRSAKRISRYVTSSQGEVFTTINRSNNSLVFIQSYYIGGEHRRTIEWHLSK